MRLKKSIWLLPLLLLFVQFNAIAQCLSGSYTIGGSTPNYTTLAQAVTALTSNGVCGPVVFNIRTGTYTEQVSIPNITGTSSTNNITFQSETGDSSATIIQFTGTSPSNNYVIKLDGADYITLNKLTLKSTGTNYTGIVLIQNVSNNFKLSNSVLDGPLTMAAGISAKHLLNSTTGINLHQTITNNLFKGGARAVNYQSNNTTVNDFIIRDNVFQDQYEYAVYVYLTKSPKVISNTFTSTLFNSLYRGIFLSTCRDSVIVSKNKLLLDSGVGITCSSTNGLPSNYVTIDNNVVYSTSTNNSSGIAASGNYINILHNTIVVNGPTTGSYCLSVNNVNYLEVKNNILQQKGLGYVYYTTGTQTNFQSDFNNLYSTAPNFSSNNSVVQPNFNAWKALGYDANSLNNLPQFVSTSDHHILSDFSQNLPVPFQSTVPDDIEGTLRDNVSPYFGAYEYVNTPIPDDASAYTFLSPGQKNCPGIAPVKIRLKNYGAQALTSAEINWTVNGVAQAPFNWTGNLAYFDTTSTVIGNVTFSAGSAFVIRAWTSLPNGAIDPYPAQDTITSGTLYSRMSGSYTIGTAGNYASINASVTDLVNRGTCGSVIFSINNGTYAENISFTGIDQSSASDYITYQSTTLNSANVTISSSTVAPVISINNIRNLKFRYISVANSAIIASNAFSIGEGVKDIEFSNCRFNILSNATAIAVSVTSSNNRLLNVNNCNFVECATALSVSANGGNYWKNVSFTQNTGEANISLTNVDTALVSDNINYNAGSNTGILIAGNTGNLRIEKNKITSDYLGIQINSLIGSNNYITNNFIVLKPGGNSFAVKVTGDIKFYNNSIRNTATSASSTALYLNSGTSGKFYNNIISNTGGGYCIQNPTATVIPSLRNNVYYKTGAFIARFPSNDIATFSQWQSVAQTDTNSFYVNPHFNSATDLHVNQHALKGAGTSVVGILTDDIDNQVRNTATPDIGADEFTPLTIDAATNGFVFSTSVCSGTQAITAIIENNGLNNLNTATIKYTVNGISQTSYAWSGNLSSGQTNTFTVGNYNFLPGTTYTIKLWSELPNSTNDVFKQNDTSLVIINTALNGGTYTIGGTSPNYATFATALNALKINGVCGPVIFNVRNGTYTEQISIGRIKGSSSVNTITFQSQNGDSSLVTLQYNSTLSTANYTLRLDSASYVTIKKIGIKALNTTNGTAVNVTGASTNQQITNCVLTGSSSSVSCFQRNNSLGVTRAVNNLSLTNNLFAGTSFSAIGVTAGIGLAPDTNLVISGNIIKGNFINGVNLYNQYNSKTFKNLVDDANFYISATGAAYVFAGMIKGEVYNNKAIVLGNGKALTLSNSNSGVGNGIMIYNNWLTAKYTSMLFNSVTDAGIYYNSCVQTTGNSGYAVLEVRSCASLKMQNNTYSKTGAGRVVYLSFTGQFSVSDHNNFYKTLSDTLFKISTTTHYNTLSAYATATSLESGSWSGDPMFNSSTDLHTTSSPTLNAHAVPIAGITTDIDGDLRNGSTPDIGSDEFTIVGISNDVQLVSVFSSPSTCGGLKTVYAKIKTWGVDTLHSLTFNYTLNGVLQTPTIWTGTLAQSATKDSIIIGTHTLYGNNQIKAWCYAPNGQLDANPINDTIQNFTLPTLGLSGIFKIGGTSPHFATIRDARNALTSYGVCGPVIFDIRPGTYTDTINIGNITGSHSFNTITFRAENGDSTSVILTDFATTTQGSFPSVLLLKNTHYLIFSKLTFQQSLTTTGLSPSLILFVGPSPGPTSSDITFNNCRFIGNNNSYHLIKDNSNIALTALNVNNCSFTGKQTGIALNANFPTNNINTIFNNSFTGFSTAIYMYGNNNTVKNNTIRNTTFSGTTGIFMEGNANSVQSNIITLLAGTGIYSEGGNDSISNNFIRITCTNCTNSKGISVFTGGNKMINYNTLKISGGSGTYGLYVDNCGSPKINNNIVEVKGSASKLLYTFGVSTPTIDYNRYYGNGTNFAKYNSTNYADFAAYKIATSHDANSQFKPTFFLNDSTYVVVGDYDLNGAATVIPQITEDIIGTTRNTSTPDIGAYEFNLLNNDAGIVRHYYSDSVLCSGTNPVSVVLRNYGSGTLTSATIKWRLNNVQQPDHAWTGSIAPGDSTNVLIGNVTLSGGKRNQFMFYTSMPNWVVDLSNINDTIRSSNYKTRLSGTYTVGGTSPDFVTFKQSMDSLNYYGVCGPTIFNLRDGSYSCQTITLNHVQGTSATNSIIIQSESLDSSLVTLQHTTTGFTVNDVSNITIRKVGFQLSATFNYTSLTVNPGNSNNIEISNCKFFNNIASNGVKIYNPGVNTTSHNIRINNNRLLSSSVYIDGTANQHNFVGLTIAGNVFTGTLYGVSIGMYSDYADSLLIANNTGGAITVKHLSNGLNISNNSIAKGDLTIENCTTTSATPINIYNNVIDSGSVYIDNTPVFNLYNNTIVGKRTFSAFIGDGILNINSTNGAYKVYNNIIINKERGLLINITDPGFTNNVVPGLFDNNVLYSAGDTLVYIHLSNAMLLKSFAQWQGIYHQDLNSVNVKPYFVGAHDLHINNDSRINNIGSPILSSTSDMDGIARNTTHPDAGAYEFDPTTVADDAGLSGPDMSAGFCDGSSNPIVVKLKNYGTNTLTSVNIHCEINGVLQSTYNWTGSLLPDSTVFVSPASFTPNINGTYNLSLFTSLPNGASDGAFYNDTCKAVNVRSMFNGTYTIGGSGADFINMATSLEALKQQGMCGATTFNISGGNYNQMYIGDFAYVPGNISLGYPITYQSASGNPNSVIINADLVYGMSFNTCYNIHHIRNLSFKNITFAGANGSNNYMVYIGRDAKDVLFSGNTLDYSTNPNNKAVIYSKEYHSGLTLLNNRIKGAIESILYSTPSVGSSPEQIKLKGNTFSDFSSNAMSFSSLGDSLVLDSNTVLKTQATGYGIYTNNCGHVLIKNNMLRGSASYNSGIYTVANDKAYIYNNVLNGAFAAGIYSGSDSSFIYYNTINNTAGNGINCGSSSEKLKIYNNIIRSSGSACYFVNTTLVSNALIDHNDHTTTGTNLLTVGGTNYSTLSAFQSATNKDLNSLSIDPQFTSSGNVHYNNAGLDGLAIPIAGITLDQQNVLRDPVNPNPGAYEGPTLYIIDTTTTYLELKRIVNDTLIVGSNNPITATVHFNAPNYIDTNIVKLQAVVTSLRMHYIIGNQAEVIETWNGSLELNDSLVYTFSQQFFVPNGKRYFIKVWFENLTPNQNEPFVADDSLAKAINLPMAGDYTVGGTYPDFASFSELSASMNYCGTSGPVRFLFRPGYYGRCAHYGAFPNNHASMELRSESGNAQDVQIMLASFDELDYLKFSNLTIYPDTAGSCDILCVGQTIIDSCKVESSSASSFPDGISIQGEFMGLTSKITNCTFNHIAYSVLLSSYSGCSAPTPDDFIFENNSISNSGAGIMVLGYQSSWNNQWIRIRNNSFQTTGQAIYITDAGSAYTEGYIEISNNTMVSSSRAVEIEESTSNKLIMYNNLISGNSGNIINAKKSMKLYNNTFNYFVNFELADSSEIYNNIFSTPTSSLNGAAKFGYSSTTVIKSDHNNYFAPYNSTKICYALYNTGTQSYVINYLFTSVQQLRDTMHIDSNSVEFTPLFVSSIDLHSRSVNMRDKATIVPFITADIDGDSRLTSVPDIGADEITMTFGTVWPGDADNDLSVTAQDYFPIGLNFYNTGYGRDTISDMWNAHYCNDWQQTQTSGTNMMFVDCNGDSTINFDDTLAIHTNYSLTHTAKLNGTTNTTTVDPDIYVTFDQPQYFAGDTVTAEVHLGSSTNVQNNFYGAAFNLTYDPNLVVPGSEEFHFNNSWLGDINLDKIVFSKTDGTAGFIDASLVRITHTNTGGFGKIATLKFILNNSISSTQLHITISNGVKVDENGIIDPITSGIDSATLVPTNVSVKDLNEDGYALSLYPNPNNGVFTLSSTEDLGEITIYDMLGKTVFSETITAKKKEIDLHTYPSGTYILKRGKHHLRIMKN